MFTKQNSGPPSPSAPASRAGVAVRVAPSRLRCLQQDVVSAAADFDSLSLIRSHVPPNAAKVIG